MRLNPPLTILALVGLCLTSLTVKRQTDEQRQAEVRRLQCDVALTHLKNVHFENVKFVSDMPLLLLETPEEVRSIEEITLASSQNPRFKNHPEIEIEIQKSKSAKLGPAKLCQNVRNWAANNRVRIEPEKIRNEDDAKPYWLIINSDDEYDWHIVQISMPVISADHKSAYFNESHYFAPLAGGGAALEYRKSSDGSWKLFERIGLYVS